jgi:hypothetical protein
MRNRLIAALLIVVAGTVLWFLRPQKQEVAARTAAESAPAPAVTSKPSEISSNTEPVEPTEDTNAPAAPVEVVAGADPAHPTQLAILEASTGPEVAPGLTPAIVMENVRRVFRQYSSRFGGNPVGTNPEITAALNGKNPKGIVFLDPDDGLRINDKGELVDNWGTPFFFHQLSGTEMEIHSAGPDRKMWTDDDLVIK